jgi:hypothetical protein
VQRGAVALDQQPGRVHGGVLGHGVTGQQQLDHGRQRALRGEEGLEGCGVGWGACERSACAAGGGGLAGCWLLSKLLAQLGPGGLGSLWMLHWQSRGLWRVCALGLAPRRWCWAAAAAWVLRRCCRCLVCLLAHGTKEAGGPASWGLGRASSGHAPRRRASSRRWCPAA